MYSKIYVYIHLNIHLKAYYIYSKTYTLNGYLKNNFHILFIVWPASFVWPVFLNVEENTNMYIFLSFILSYNLVLVPEFTLKSPRELLKFP